MFNLTDAQKEASKNKAIKSKESFIYLLSLQLGIDPEQIDLTSNIEVLDESAENYASSVILYNAIEDLKRLKNI